MKAISRALIIDDDEINNFLCIRNMEDLDFAQNATFCLRGQEGLDELQEALENHPENLPDVIFLDINMPRMNAWEFLESYKQLQMKFPKHIQLFILSSSVYRKDKDKSIDYEVVTDFILKPLTKNKLKEIQEKYFS